MRTIMLGYAAVFMGTACAGESDTTAYVGASVFDGTGRAPIENAVMVVREGRIADIGPAGSVNVPSGATRVDLAGRYVTPGLINTHGHVGDTRGLEREHYSEENILRHLALYARYGVTTVNSLGGDGPDGIRVRDAQHTPTLDRARLFVAGTVVTGETPEEALDVTSQNADLGVNFIKFRVDDNLGVGRKMAPEIFRAVIQHAHERRLRAVSHLFYLDDAKDLVRAGVDFVAHSVRDMDVDDELIDLLNERLVCYTPTLTREISTFAYEDRPEFFDDPFFLREADSAVIAQLEDPERQREVRDNPSAQLYKQALEVALRNLKRLADAGVTIAFGTDTGPPTRFQGYFEHMELGLMAEAGLTSEQILRAATGDAAACLGFEDLGTLEAGKWADFVVLERDPLADIANMRSIESVWIAGNRVPARE